VEVTPASRMPHGTMSSKSSSAVFTFSANPWVVIHRAMCTPTAPIFRGSPAASEPTQTPGHFSMRAASMPCSASARIIPSSTLRTCRRTSFRSGARSRMG
jgi:hypothetical protein